MLDVIIVGGGVSGLCAAASLEAAGLTCLLLEGRSRLGGRVCSSASGIDLGAQWIHGHMTSGLNPLYDLARKAQLPLRAFDYDNSATYDAKGKLVGDREVDAWEKVWKGIEHSLPSRTEPTVAGRVEALLGEMALSPAMEAGVRHCVATYIECEFGADAEWLCGRGYDEGEIEGKDYVLPGGLHTIIPVLAAALKTTRVLLGKSVRSVHYSPGGVRVTAAAGAGPEGGQEEEVVEYTARAALVTIPLGVLQQSLREVGGNSGSGSGYVLPRVEGAATLQFHPPLPPSHTTAIAALGMGVLNKYIMEWGGAEGGARLRALLPKGVEMLECSDACAPFPELVVLGHHAPHHANALMAFSAGSRSLALGGCKGKGKGEKEEEGGASPATAADGGAASPAPTSPHLLLLSQLRAMLGPTLPPPTTFTATRWELDPFACGSYSFLPPGVSPAHRDALAQGVQGVLWFAGEHTCGDHPSTVHGAMLSGRRAAASIARGLKGGGGGGRGEGGGGGGGKGAQ